MPLLTYMQALGIFGVKKEGEISWDEQLDVKPRRIRSWRTSGSVI